MPGTSLGTLVGETRAAACHLMLRNNMASPTYLSEAAIEKALDAIKRHERLSHFKTGALNHSATLPAVAHQPLGARKFKNGRGQNVGRHIPSGMPVLCFSRPDVTGRDAAEATDILPTHSPSHEHTKRQQPLPGRWRTTATSVSYWTYARCRSAYRPSAIGPC